MRSRTTTVTILCENSVRKAGLLGEHGLAYWIETGTHRVLFDTGQGMTLLHNAARLGIPLAEVDAAVLSHGHYDHVSGLQAVLDLAPDAALWMHPAAVQRKYLCPTDAAARRVSIDLMESQAFGAGRDIHWVTAPTEVVPGVWVTGEVPRRHFWEDTGGRFFLDEAGRLPDLIRDDVSLFFPHEEGVSVLFGCAHAGVGNILEHIADVTGHSRALSLVGGLHLGGASAERLDRTVELLKSWAPSRLGFCHCTGGAATRRLWREFPEVCIEAHAGAKISGW